MFLPATDTMSEHGAHVLKAKIENYWAKRGVFPTVWVDAVLVGREVLHCVRSNLAALVLVRPRRA